MKRYLSLGALMLAALGASFLQTNDCTAQAKNDWGTVKGQVVFAGGAVPEPVILNVNKDQEHCLKDGPIHSEEWIINKDNKGIANAFVWLAPVKGGAPLPIHPNLMKIQQQDVVMDQPCCAFIPHALAMREGQVLVAKNSSPIAHNTHWTGHPLKNPGGNVIVPAKQEHKIADLKADRFPIKISCDIHPWMSAYVRVYNHPYFAVTDKDGKFEIKLAPAGSWQLVGWHERTGWTFTEERGDGKPITVKAGGETDFGKIELK
jgi:hypothetical protein